jgi:prophage regulatory protein
MVEDRLLKINDVLKIMPMAKSTLWQRVKDGVLPQPVHIGTSTFWRYSDLQAFIGDLGKSQTPPIHLAG